MDWLTSLFLLGLVVIGLVFVGVLTRPLNRKLQRWMAAHRFGTQVGASIVMIVGGAAILYLLISYNSSNPFAMAAATFFIGFGTFSVIRLLWNKGA